VCSVELKHKSLAEIPEPELVKRLVDDPVLLSDLLAVKGIPSHSVPHTRVPFAGLPGDARGDVDLLLVDPSAPHQATAVEVKRVKFDAEALRTGRPNGLQGLKKGLRQAGTLAGIGFWQPYLYAVVVVDSRERNAGRITFEGLSPDQERAVDAFLESLALPPRVGLIRYDFVQSMDDVPLRTGSGGTRLIHLATPAPQPAGVTEWVRCCPTRR
jgi:hypothetical protein